MIPVTTKVQLISCWIWNVYFCAFRIAVFQFLDRKTSFAISRGRPQLKPNECQTFQKRKQNKKLTINNVLYFYILMFYLAVTDIF